MPLRAAAGSMSRAPRRKPSAMPNPWGEMDRGPSSMWTIGSYVKLESTGVNLCHRGSVPFPVMEDFATAHQGAPVGPVPHRLLERAAREEEEHRTLAPGATRAVGAGNRVRPEQVDPY